MQRLHLDALIEAEVAQPPLLRLGERGPVDLSHNGGPMIRKLIESHVACCD
jgi:hypothetical protein